jgi:hypothetical protein
VPKKAEILTNPNNIITHQKQLLVCLCGKKYKHRSTPSQHKQICSFDETTMALNQPSASEADFQSKLISTLKEVLPQMASTNITNNHNTNSNNRISNNQINLFLSEKCADAMSIQQFAKQLAFTIDDVLLQNQDALVKAINQNLGPLEVTERPVHCTNLARRRWHVKDETDEWRKDDGSSLIRYVNNSLLRKSPAQYVETFPGWCTEPNRKKEYIQIVGVTLRETEPKVEARVLTNVGQTTQLLVFP